MKKVLSLALAFAMLFTLAVGFSGSAATKNMVAIDEEFVDEITTDAYVCGWDAIEDGTPRYPTYILGSWTDVAEGNVTIGFDTESYKFGTKSVKVETKKMGHTCVLFPTYGIEKGKTYTLSFWLKTNKILGTWGFSSEVEFQYAANLGDTQVKLTDAVPLVGGDRITGTKDWMKYSLTFQAPQSDWTFAAVSCMLWEGLGTFWVDGVTLVEGETALASDDAAATPDPANCGGPKAVDSSNKVTGSTPVTEAPKPTEAPVVEDKPSDWAVEEVGLAVNAGLVPDHINSKFTSDITRSDFCDLIIKMIEVKTGKAIDDVIAGYADAKTDVSFPDTDSANVIAAAKLGIVNGRASGAFDPTANITRQEAAKMLALGAKVLGADITATEVEFADAADIYAWAKDYINYVNGIGVMKGTSTTTPPNFSPLRTYTREQSILTVYRLFNAIVVA